MTEDFKPSFEETVTYTTDSFINLLFALRQFYLDNGYSEQEASMHAVQRGHEALNQFSSQSSGIKVSKPSSEWVNEFDAILREIKSKKQYYPVYQKLLMIRKKIKS